jgi:hypothetical protein
MNVQDRTPELPSWQLLLGLFGVFAEHRHCVPQHFPHCLASKPELPRRLAFTHLIDDDRVVAERN